MSTTALEPIAHHGSVVEHEEHHGGLIPIAPERQLQFNRLGMWLFIISETFLFAGILIMRIVLGRDTEGFVRPELSQGLGLLITSILLASSFFVNRGEVAIKHNDRFNFNLSIFLALVLGLVFVVGVAYEWNEVHKDFGPATGPVINGMFYFMTGIHALHVITGIIFLLVVFLNGIRGKYSAKSHWGVESAALYWHFVDVVWVFFYVALYLIGTVAEPMK
ncbi:MAG: heme-copper oxidase subunit III [Chloroflexi bacterium]|nr:heme-copper oxidase subunit III [Chloroflexota bacterium]